MSGDDVDATTKVEELAKKLKEADFGMMPKAGLPTDGSSGDLLVIERVVRQSSSMVEVPLLTHSNYTEWALVVQVQIQAQGWWEAIDPGVCNYHDDDREAMGFILRAVPPELLRSLPTKSSCEGGMGRGEGDADRVIERT